MRCELGSCELLVCTTRQRLEAAQSIGPVVGNTETDCALYMALLDAAVACEFGGLPARIRSRRELRLVGLNETCHPEHGKLQRAWPCVLHHCDRDAHAAASPLTAGMPAAHPVARRAAIGWEAHLHLHLHMHLRHPSAATRRPRTHRTHDRRLGCSLAVRTMSVHNRQSHALGMFISTVAQPAYAASVCTCASLTTMHERIWQPAMHWTRGRPLHALRSCTNLGWHGCSDRRVNCNLQGCPTPYSRCQPHSADNRSSQALV